jgi:Undecaprenyl-phosphate galactose phosphotransferase WbaP
LRWFIGSDVLALFFGFAIAWLSAFAINEFILDRTFASGSLFVEHVRFVQFTLIGTGVLLWLAHLGHYRVRMPFWFGIQQIAKAFGFALVIDGFFQFASRQEFSRIWLIAAWFFAGISVILARLAVRYVLQEKDQWNLRTLLVGSGIITDETRAALQSEPDLGYKIVMQIENLTLLLAQTNNSWKALCDRFNADFVMIAMDGQSLANAGEALAQLTRENIPFSVSPPLRYLPVLGMTPQYFFSHDVMLMMPRSNLEEPMARLAKRMLDVFGAFVGLALLSPLMIYFALLVKKDGGSVFYGDKRQGMNGRSFTCLKFRSMAADSDKILESYFERNPDMKQEWNQFHKLQNDPRVTKIGAFMRKWSLDELPQLINVLRGDMSLVGPRPINAQEMKEYEEATYYNKVRPGLTGLWQVSGRSNISFARRTQIDSWYVRNWSLWHDLAILFKTVPAVLKKTGAV